MKSIPVPAGNVKMRGKRTHRMSCGCCVAVNFKFEENQKEAAREIERFKREQN